MTDPLQNKCAAGVDKERAFGGFVHVRDPGEHPEKRQRSEGRAAGRHERPELDAGRRRAGRQHGRSKVSSAPLKEGASTPRSEDRLRRDGNHACFLRDDSLRREAAGFIDSGETFGDEDTYPD